MSGWVELIGQAQSIVNAGDSLEASRLLRRGLSEFKRDAAATGWLNFNLMLSEIQARGPEASRDFVDPILSSAVTWSAKLYTLELAMASLPATEADDRRIYALAVAAIGEWSSGASLPEDVNLISCQSLVRHLRRLFSEHPLSPLFEIETREDDFPVQYSWQVNDVAPMSVIDCNRMPRALRTTLECYQSPMRPLGFRHVGRAYILRFGENTLIFDRQGHLLDTPYGPLPAFVRQRFERAFPNLKPRFSIEGTSLFVGDFFSQAPNYCHWVLDALPRIAAARASGLKFDRVISAIPVTLAFQKESLSAFLQDGESLWAPTIEDGLVEIDDLYFADNGSIERLYHPVYGCDRKLLGALRTTFGITPTESTGRRLYVPRRHSRVVSNESELITLLQKHLFEIVNTDAMSIRQQIDTFAEASAIIGPHGAALTNILFSPAGTAVLELFPAFGGSASFYRLAPALGQNYSCYIDDVSHGFARDEVEALASNTASIHVDLDFVCAWLDKLS